MNKPPALPESALVQELRRSLARLELALSQISDALVITDGQGCVLWCNGSFERLQQQPRLLMLGRSFLDLLQAAMVVEAPPELSRLVKDNPLGGEVTLVMRRDPLLVLELEWRPVQSEQPAPYVYCLHDVSDRVSLEELRLRSQELMDQQLALAQQVVTCPVTGLPNRRGLGRSIEAALQRLERHGGWVAVLFCDLNRFKEVNDTYGHQVGDQLLIELAQRMQQVLRPEDVLARLGGDEFVLLCTDLETPDEALKIAERLLDAVCVPWIPEAMGMLIEINPQMSIGISLTRSATDTPDQLLHGADLAMYEAKTQSGRQIVVFDDVINAQLNRRIAIRSSLQQALRLNCLAMVFQPVVSLKRAEVVGYEALVRPCDLEGEPIPPLDLIRIAEASGLIAPLGQLVLEQSLRAAVESGLFDQGCGLAVNFSPQQLVYSGLSDTVIATAERFKVPPHLLSIEVTETALIHQPQRTRDELTRLRQAGFRVLLDDFGTGYSSLNWLAELPIDGLKIDCSFTATMTEDPRRLALIAAILQLARDLNLEVVAEGIERMDQWQALRQMGCGFGQGYLFSAPLPAGQAGGLPSVLLPAAC
ncbi:MAG: putative bifunctional diguanylate cyclase/phosphodiesterase [Cyanobacteriota bacterium]